MCNIFKTDETVHLSNGCLYKERETSDQDHLIDWKTTAAVLLSHPSTKVQVIHIQHSSELDPLPFFREPDLPVGIGGEGRGFAGGNSRSDLIGN